MTHLIKRNSRTSIVSCLTWSEEKKLETELKRPDVNIDGVDSENKTALSWTVRRGDVAATELLLAHGADPNISDNGGHAPIHYAALAKNPDCMAVMARAGIDVNAGNLTKETALHFACSYQDDARYIKPLLTAGSDVDELSGVGRTPLIYAARENHAIAAGFLMENGADINRSDWKGLTPLHVAISRSSIRVLRLLLDCGADHLLVDYTGSSILHIAALSANAEILELLDLADLGGLDPDAINNDGYSPSDLISLRGTVNGQTKESFYALVRKLRELRAEQRSASVHQPEGAENSPSAVVMSDEQDANIFHNTLEYIELL